MAAKAFPLGRKNTGNRVIIRADGVITSALFKAAGQD
jgi:hypothetical protein